MEAVYTPGPRRMTFRDSEALGDPDETKWDDTWEERTIDPEDKNNNPLVSAPSTDAYSSQIGPP